MSKIILGISGSIAAYKSADLTSRLTKNGHEIHVAMTQSAQSFITPLTLQVLSKNYVRVDVLEEQDARYVDHIEITKDASLFVIAPATANMIAKIAHGIADDMVSTLFAVFDPKKVLIAPAMNTAMYQHPILILNMDKLKSIGVRFIEPKEGLLACSDYGKGALADLDVIVEAINQAL